MRNAFTSVYLERQSPSCECLCVEEAFAEHVRGFMDSNPGLDESFGAIFENIFMSLEDDFVLPDPSEVAAAEAAARDSFAVELPSPPQPGRARKGKKGGKKKTRK